MDEGAVSHALLQGSTSEAHLFERHLLELSALKLNGLIATVHLKPAA